MSASLQSIASSTLNPRQPEILPFLTPFVRTGPIGRKAEFDILGKLVLFFAVAVPLAFLAMAVFLRLFWHLRSLASSDEGRVRRPCRDRGRPVHAEGFKRIARAAGRVVAPGDPALPAFFPVAPSVSVRASDPGLRDRALRRLPPEGPSSTP